MKTIVNKFFIIAVCLFGVLEAFSAPHPPPPNGKKPPPPPGLPIDDNLYFLLIVGLFFGVYIIYKRQLNRKTSI